MLSALLERESTLPPLELLSADRLRSRPPLRLLLSRRARTHFHPPSHRAAQKIECLPEPCANRKRPAESRCHRRSAASLLPHRAAARAISSFDFEQSLPPKGSVGRPHRWQSLCVPFLEVNSIYSAANDQPAPISIIASNSCALLPNQQASA